MNIKSFRGGIHPPQRKKITENLPIEPLFPHTNAVCIPITQGGAPNAPIVKVGDTVARGQKIAESDAFMSVPVHASIAGVVKKIENHLVIGNTDALCIIIEDDGSGQTSFMDPLDPFTCTTQDAVKRVRDAGIVGMGGASFPTHVKLNPPKECKIDLLIANGAECEPYLTIDARMMQESASKIVDGIAIAMRITGASRGIIAVEDNKLDVLPYLEKAVAELRANPIGAGARNISVAYCKTKYPQGSEKILIKALTGKEVPSGCLPAHVGCVVNNVGTLKAISEAFREGKPLIERTLTVSGGSCVNPRNIEVPVGTLLGDLIPSSFTLHPGTIKIVVGGPMMGIAMKSANFPIIKSTSGILFLSAKEASIEEEGACIGCGRCIPACHCRLIPVQMMKALKASDLEESKRYGLMDCVECGACDYVCPARIKLVQRFREGKQLERAEIQKKKEMAAAQNSAKGVR
ncbi:electron transport complex subunit RsxC [Brucepastera parasyntrophica]|uniref:electron transport complex subunit RsxC n=1 Tax=Brucepastera parasyntrophica TaxID=2880008 RepID=UPI00210DC2AB|nr:electron transport complex subunit RsxC [Brucepastera parasyntrophica]ULQ60782.1 electron transport complex subunit RsxC [Brucepastera parasyntrophica]